MFWALCLLASTGVILLIQLLVTKRHPKGYPPGPTGIPLFGYLPWLGRLSHVNIGKLGKKYGNIFSVQMGSSSIVILNNLETVKSALKLDTFAGRPNHLIPMSLYKLGVVFSTGEVWKEQRRFSLRMLRDMGFGKKSMEEAIQEEVTDLVNYFRSQANKPIYFQEVFAISVLNALWLILADEKFSLDDPEPRKLHQLAKEGLTDPDLAGPLFALPWLTKILPGKAGLARVEECKETLKATMREIVIKHQQKFIPGSRRDYIDLYLQKMMETTDPASSFFQEFGVDNLVDSLIQYFTAGQDTLTCTTEFTLLYLLTHPENCRKIQAEIDRVVGRARVPNVTDRPKMPYLEAVMQESLRMSSIAPGSILHNTTEDVEFMGYNLPKGTIIMPNLYQIHYNEHYWKDPHSFRPERFINEDGTFRKDENVIAFSTGKRVCPAENIAMAELFLFLANILQVFDIEVDPDCPLPGFEARKPALVLSPNYYKIVFKERS